MTKVARRLAVKKAPPVEPPVNEDGAKRQEHEGRKKPPEGHFARARMEAGK